MTDDVRRASASDSDDEPLMEIGDFTVVTPLEAFSVAIENQLTEWRLANGPKTPRTIPKGAFSNCQWESQHVRLQFGAENTLMMSHYRAKDIESWKSILVHPSPAPVFSDTSSNETDWNFTNNISQMFGLAEFVVLTPLDSDVDRITNESQQHLIVSALNLAATQAQCTIPMLVQIGEPERQCYAGMALSHDGCLARFDVAHLMRLHRRHEHLEGLLDLFKQHVHAPLELDDCRHELRVSVRLEYSIREASDNALVGRFENMWSGVDVEELPFSTVHKLPVGALNEPLDKIRVFATWSSVREEALNENDAFSDLDATQAPHWAALAEFDPSARTALVMIVMQLTDWLQASQDAERQESLLAVLGRRGGKSVKNLQFGTYQNTALPSLSNPGGLVLDELDVPLSQDMSERAVDEIFGEPSPSSSSTEHLSGPGVAQRESLQPLLTGEQRSEHTVTSSSADVEKCLHGLKSAPRGTLAERIALALAQLVLNRRFEPRLVAQVWAAIIDRLRNHYETNRDLPGLSATTTPDLAACLLQQKLEMLQCCLAERRKRHGWMDAAAAAATTTTTSSSKRRENGDAESVNEEDEDKYFDASSDKSGSSCSETEDTDPKKAAEVVAASCPEPQGRLEQHATLTLLDHSDVPIWVPITQDRAPLTEDALERMSSYLSSLDDPDERMRAQLDTLQSDMSAFKAANPLASMADFIRWHSPRDWDQETGALSERMSQPGNAWAEAWQQARPVPVAKQHRLFNDAKEAEEILLMLESASVTKLASLILPIVTGAAVRQLAINGAPLSGLIDFSALGASAVSATRTNERDDYLSFLGRLRVAERVLARYEALTLRLPSDGGGADEIRDFRLELLRENVGRKTDYMLVPRGVQVPGGAASPTGLALRELLSQDARIAAKASRFELGGGGGGHVAKDDMPPLDRRLYVLRWTTRRGVGVGVASRPLPQRLFAALEEDECRLAGSFSHDLLFV